MLADYLNVIVLFMIVAVGYILARKQILTKVTNQSFVTLLLHVTLPLLLIISIEKDFSKDEFLKMLPDAYLPFINILLLIVLSYLVARLLKVDEKRRGLFVGVCSMSSTIFFGIPITLAIFGVKGLPYGLIYYVAQTVIYWTIGMYILKKDIIYTYNIKQKFSLKDTLKSVFSMPLIAFIIGVTILLLGIRLPSFLESFGNYLGGMTSPLAMLVIGSLIYFTGFKQLKVNRDVIIVLIFRFIIAPGLALLLGTLLHVDPMMVKVTVIMAALPIPNTTVLLVDKFKTDTNFATTVLTYSTIIFLIYIPFLLWISNFIH